MLTLGLVKTPLLPPPDIGWDNYLRDLPRIDIETELAGRFPPLRSLFCDSRKRNRLNASEENLLPGNGKKAKRGGFPQARTPSQPPPGKRNRAQSPINPSAAAMRAKYAARSPARPPARPFQKSPNKSPSKSPNKHQSLKGKPNPAVVASPKEKRQRKKASPATVKMQEDPFNSPHMDIFMGLLRHVDNKKFVPQQQTETRE